MIDARSDSDEEERKTEIVVMPLLTPDNEKQLVSKIENAEFNADDSVLYAHALYRDDDDEYNSIFVGNPEERNGKVFYHVCAYDSDGKFECRRRYNDFHALRQAFLERLPGLYIPSLPPKKVFGNSDKKFLDERAFHLMQFMKKVYKLPYLLGSQELQVFAREDLKVVYRESRASEVQNQTFAT